MKKIFICIFALLCFFTFASAEELGVAEPSLLPNNPFYFLKDIGREVQLFLTFNPIKKAELRMDFVNQKLAEAEKVSENNPSNQDAINKALENYKKETEKLYSYAATLNKNNSDNQALLNKIVSNNLLHQVILEQMEYSLSNKEKIAEVKTKSLENLTNASFSVSTSEQVKEKLQEKLQSQDIKPVSKIEILDKMEERLNNQEQKKAIIQLQEQMISQNLENENLTQEEKLKIEEIANELSTNTTYKKMILENFTRKIITENQSVLNQLDGISQEDLQKLNDLAQNILSQEAIDINNVVTEFNSLEISPESKGIIDDVIGDLINKINKDDIACATIYNPVCGTDNKTYPSACEAKKAGIDIDYKGECGACVQENGRAVLNKQNCCDNLVFCPVAIAGVSSMGICRKTCESNNDILCTTEYSPVCGDNNKTYSNACEAKRAGVGVKYKGRCEDDNPNSAIPNSQSQTPAVPSPNSIQTANPSSEYCLKLGYALEIRKGSNGGEYGVCKFPDGTECEEWAFYRGECGASFRK